MATDEDKIDQWARNGIDRSVAEDRLHDALAAYGLGSENDATIAIWKLLYAKGQIKAGALALPHLPTETNAAPIESAPFCNMAAGNLIRQIIEERDWPLCEEALRILVHLKKRLHPVAIPICLERMGQRFVSYAHLQSVLGERARWLSRQRDAWLWLESMSHFSADAFNAPFRAWWPLYLWHSTNRPAEMNQLLAQHIEGLSTKDKQVVVEWISKHGDASHLHILSAFSAGRSRILSRLVLNTRLELRDPELHEQISHFASRYMKEALIVKKKRLSFKPVKSQLAPEISFPLEDINLFSEYFTDPLMQLLCLSAPSAWLPEERTLYADALMQDEDLDKLVQIILAGARLHGDKALIMLLCEKYFLHYPSGNTLDLNAENAFAGLDGKSYNYLLKIILKNTERRFEKLGLIISEKSPYFSRSHSDEIIEYIIDAFYYNLPHTEMIMLSQSLPFFATKLDPRIYPKLKSRLRQDAILT